MVEKIEVIFVYFRWEFGDGFVVVKEKEELVVFVFVGFFGDYVEEMEI